MATILLLALTVTLFASIFAFVTAFPAPPAQNNNQFQASLVITANLSYVSGIRITHLAGPAVSGGGLIYLKSANQPTAPEFQKPYSVSSGLSGAPTWNLGQTWVLTFPLAQMPLAKGNITIYVVSQAQLLFSVILPGTSLSTPPTIVSTWTYPATPLVGSKFSVNASLAGTYGANSVYVNLASVPGGPPTAKQMTRNATTGQWYFTWAAGATTAGTYYGFVNATGSNGQAAVGAVVITITTSGGTNGPFSVGVVLVPSPPNTGASDSVQAVVTYTGVLSTPQALNVSFTAISNPYVAGNRWTGWSPTGATISGGSSVTVVSKTTWTIPANPAVGTSFIVYANATVATIGTVPGTMTFTPAYVTLSASSGLIGSTVTATGSSFGSVTPVSFTVGGVLATITGCSSDTSFTASSVVTTSTGTFVCTVQIAANTPATAVTMISSDSATGQNDTSAFSVNDWAITPSPNSGLIGANVTLTGANFASTASITVSYAGIPVAPTLCTTGSRAGYTITATGGGFVCTVLIPNGAPAGLGTFSATSTAWGTTATNTFTVTAWKISLSPATGLHTSTLFFNMTGSGFMASSLVSFYSNSATTITVVSCSSGTLTTSPSTSVTTTPTGGFVCEFKIASGGVAGAIQFVASDVTSGQSATATYTRT